MSMLSAQCDELRKWADQLSERENEFGVVVRALVVSLREAADTIWELRDSLDLSLDSKRIAERRVTELLAENDRLREFASKSFSMAFNFYHGAGTAEDLRELKVEYHELGIEMEP